MQLNHQAVHTRKVSRPSRSKESYSYCGKKKKIEKRAQAQFRTKNPQHMDTDANSVIMNTTLKLFVEAKKRVNRNVNTSEMDKFEEALFNSLCTISTSHQKAARSIALYHHNFDQLSHTGINKCVKSPP